MEEVKIMKLLINSVDIIDDVNLLEAVYEDYATASSNRLYLKFDDGDNEWQNWKLKRNDEIKIIDGQCNSGAMYIHSNTLSNGLCEIFAKSIPYISPEIQQKTFENVKLSKIAKETAKEFGFAVNLKNVTDRLYKSLNLNNVTHIKQLKQLCALEGVGLAFYNNKLILFDEHKIENMDSSGDLIVESDDNFSICDNSEMLIGKCVIKNADLTGKFRANNGSSDIYTYCNDTPASTTGELNRFAKGILRAVNKKVKSGTITTDLKTEFSAGSVVNIVNDKAKLYNGKVFIYKVRHDFVNDKTKVFFRYVIEEY